MRSLIVLCVAIFALVCSCNAEVAAPSGRILATMWNISQGEWVISGIRSFNCANPAETVLRNDFQMMQLVFTAADIQNNIFYVVGGDYYTLQWQGFDATTGKTVVPMQKADVGDQAQSGVFWPSKGLLLAVLRGGAVLAINPKTAVVQTYAGVASGFEVISYSGGMAALDDSSSLLYLNTHDPRCIKYNCLYLAAVDLMPGGGRDYQVQTFNDSMDGGVFNPATRTIVASTGGALVSIDPRTGKIVDTYINSPETVLTASIALTQDGHTAYVSPPFRAIVADLDHRTSETFVDVSLASVQWFP